MHRKFDDSFKIMAVDLSVVKGSVADVAKKLDIDPSLLSKWRRNPRYNGNKVFSKMILIGASPRYLNDTNYVGGFKQEGLNQFYDTMATNYFAWVSGFSSAAMANPENPQLAENFALTLKAIRPDIAQSVARVIFQSAYRNELTKLDKPTLLIQANEDIAVPLSVA